jgi:type IV pilus assembly protein PilA
MSLNLRAQRFSGERGFTLIELLVVLLIVGILAAIAIPSFFNQTDKASDAGAKEMAHTAQVAMEALGAENDGSYATASRPNLKAIEGSILTARGNPPKPYVSAATGTSTSWNLTVTAPTGNRFRIVKRSNGVMRYTCTVPAGQDRGGCPSGGRWG